MLLSTQDAGPYSEHIRLRDDHRCVDNGYYLLRGRYPETVTGLGARVWVPSTTFANYTGDLLFNPAATVVGNFFEGEQLGTLRTGSNTLTVINPSRTTTLLLKTMAISYMPQT